MNQTKRDSSAQINERKGFRLSINDSNEYPFLKRTWHLDCCPSTDLAQRKTPRLLATRWQILQRHWHCRVFDDGIDIPFQNP